MAIDPVCGMQVSEENAAATEEYMGKTYYFCSQYCRDEFVQDPEAYVGEVEMSEGEEEEAA